MSSDLEYPLNRIKRKRRSGSASASLPSLQCHSPQSTSAGGRDKRRTLSLPCSEDSPTSVNAVGSSIAEHTAQQGKTQASCSAHTSASRQDTELTPRPELHPHVVSEVGSVDAESEDETQLRLFMSRSWKYSDETRPLVSEGAMQVQSQPGDDYYHDEASGHTESLHSSALQETASHEGTLSSPLKPSKIRFASTDNIYDQLGDEHAEVLEMHRSSPHHIRTLFSNPFSSSADVSRKASDSSDNTYYFRPGAFLGHRDTLARITCRHLSYDQAVSAVHSARSSMATTIHRFAGHRDTLARIHPKYRMGPPFPRAVIEQILQYLNFADYKALRLTCRRWSSSLPQPLLPALYRVPREILQQIYLMLSPADFHRARHTCRSWFLAALDKNLLLTMLAKAGHVHAFRNDHRGWKMVSDRRRRLKHQDDQFEPSNEHDLNYAVSEEWLCSKRLGTEARLSPHGRENGLDKKAGSARPTPSMSVTQLTDLSVVTQSMVHRPQSPLFTAINVSTCGRYVLIIQESLITVYGVGGGSSILAPAARLDCGDLVSRVSMDTSSGRYSVAVLLHNSKGLCWDLKQLNGTFARHISDLKIGAKQSQKRRRSWYQPPWQAHHNHTAVHTIFITEEGRHRQTSVAAGVRRSSLFAPQTIWEMGHRRGTEHFSSLFGQEDELAAEQGLSVQTCPTKTYTNLGTSDDPPRSVAICPHRKCVAFGCQTRIELHWVDAYTGADLNRWFPLAIPSDHLYFLPQLGSSTRKLRLISSAAVPVSVEMSNVCVAPVEAQNRQHQSQPHSMTRLFFPNPPFSPAGASSGSPDSIHSNVQEIHGIARTVVCDHFRAYPISDGRHTLFTDPATGAVCLGSDAPPGGRTKLLRKVVLLPPADFVINGSTCESPRQTCYAAGQDLRWGVRIVVAYDNGQVVLYNIPSDHFEKIRHIKSSQHVWNEQIATLAEHIMTDDWVYGEGFMTAHATSSTEPHAANNSAQTMTRDATPGPFAALKCLGVVIAAIEAGSSVEDIAVDSAAGGLKVWLFLSNAQAMLLDVYAPQGHAVELCAAASDGTICSDTQPDIFQSPDVSPTLMCQDNKQTP